MTEKPALPIISDKSPSLIMGLIYSMRVRDVMSKNLVVAAPQDKLSRIKQLMKERNITGVPIARERRLVGVVSMHDIFMAMDAGHMEEPAEKHMAKKIIMLEEDMPLAFAISYFNKFKYGRFPVVDKYNLLVGIVTSRDINVGLLQAINTEVEKLEKKLESVESEDTGTTVKKVFRIHKYDFENAGKASNKIKQILVKRKLSARDIRRVAVAMYELEINITVHAEGGRVEVLVDDDKAQIMARDHAPGIEDVQLALKKGYSTANEWIKSLGFGAGMGLFNVQRVADEFNIESALGKGTTVKAVIYFGKGEANDEDKRS